jgi:Ni,Fe-hydrogenase I cytochrome b subunit
MLLTIIQDPIEAALVGYFLINFRFIFVGFGLYSIILTKNKFKHEYGTKEIIFLYMNDAYKILSYHRSLEFLWEYHMLQ